MVSHKQKLNKIQKAGKEEQVQREENKIPSITIRIGTSEGRSVPSSLHKDIFY